MSTSGAFTPIQPTADFWRGNAALTEFPDGSNDVTQTIARTGLVGVGLVPSNTPVATLDVASVPRSGADGRVVGVTPFYVTGNIPPIPGTVGIACPNPTPVGGVEFRHSNQTQGIGFAYNGLYATGSSANQDMGFLNRGNGQFGFAWQTKNAGNLDYMNYSSPVAAVVGGGFIQRWWQACADVAQWYPFLVEKVGPLNARMQWDITRGGSLAAALRLGPSYDCAGVQVGSVLEVGENQVINKKLVLFNVGVDDQDQFYGFGINNSTLRYQISGTGAWNRWYASTGPCASQEIFAVSGLARVIVDPAGLNTGVCTSGYLSFGTEAANVASIFSKRNVGGNANGLDFALGCTVRESIAANGNVRFNAHGLTADTNAGARPGLNAAHVVIDDAGTVGNNQQAQLWVAVENCGGPCGQGMPPAIGITNNNGTSGDIGRIAWFPSGAGAEQSSIQGFNGNTLRVNATTFQVTGAAQKPGGGVWAVFSDERLKRDIAPYAHGLDLLRGLKPVSYRYKEITGWGDASYVGLVAQDVLEVAPALVDSVAVAEHDPLADLVGDHYLTLDTSELQFTLLNAVLELDKRLATLEGNS